MRLVFKSPQARDTMIEKYDVLEGGNQRLDRLYLSWTLSGLSQGLINIRAPL
jgi:hypothetical protein